MSRAKTLQKSLFSHACGAEMPEIPTGRRVYAIGDVHGRLDLLHDLLRRIADDHKARGGEVACEIILLGDLIDRGPDSAGVVELARAWVDPMMTLVTLKGNHEASLQAVLEGETRWLLSWLSYGGQACLESYGLDPAVLMSGELEMIISAARKAVPASHQSFIASLPLMARRGDYAFVHAGVKPGVPLEAQVEADLIWIRDEFLDSPVDHGAVIVHGHTIRPEIELRPNRIGIDTGAYRSGKLSAVGLEGSDYWLLATGV